MVSCAISSVFGERERISIVSRIHPRGPPRLTGLADASMPLLIVFVRKKYGHSRTSRLRKRETQEIRSPWHGTVGRARGGKTGRREPRFNARDSWRKGETETAFQIRR